MKPVSTASFVLAMIAGCLLTYGNLNLSGAENIHSAPVASQPWAIPLPDGATLDLKWIPPGTFVRGCPENEMGRKTDEGPPTHITFPNGFWMGKTLVTIAQWKKVMGFGVREQLARRINDDTLHDLGGKRQTLRDFMRWSRDTSPTIYLANEGDDLPMYYVSWNDAMEFCHCLTEIEHVTWRLPKGYAYSLPTEAQWEYACRAGTTGSVYTESATAASLGKIAWYDKNGAEGYSGRGFGPTHSGPREVGRKESNAWGLYDMYGNIWQWCRDWYGPYAKEDTTDPTGPATGTFRVNHGGSFGSGASALRSAARAANPPPEASAYRGFRIVLCISEPR